VEAREKGATIIHVDPRYTRTSAMADIWVPLRAGSDIIFLGALVHYVLENHKEFRDYVVHYTNAATILREDFRDTEDLDGLFSGWDQEKRKYDPEISLRERRRRQRPRRLGPRHSEIRVRSHAPASAMRFPGLEAPLRSLHPRDGRALLRRSARHLFEDCAGIHLSVGTG
jgi:anaerobic selenocysteine-containing dehydrogenase